MGRLSWLPSKVNLSLLYFQAVSSKPAQLPPCFPHPAAPRTEPLLGPHLVEYLASMPSPACPRPHPSSGL